VGVPETDTSSVVKTFQREMRLRTAGGLTVTDITDDVQEAVRQSGVSNGICCVYSPHTTCSVRVNEWERGFLEDFAVLLKRLVPAEHYYAHDDWDRRTENLHPDDMEVGNGHRVDPRPGRRALPRLLAAGALPRARPRARPALARPGRRRLTGAAT
jgi:secondary thiamine-phosphate synthase enzyme